MSFGVARATSVMDALVRADRWIRLVVAAVFLVVGVYCLVGL